MPELPEVETVARTLRPHVEGRFIVDAQIVRNPCLLKGSLPIAKAKGACITAVGRRAKLVLLDLRLADGTSARMAMHLRMTGRLMVRALASADEKAMLAKDDPYARAFFMLSDTPDGPATAQVWFSDVRTFGRILFAVPKDFDKWEFWRELGPEPLSLAPEDFAPRLKGTGAIKARLLDQTVIAGIGNIYADESLFAAGIHPKAPAGGLSYEAKARLLAEIKAVLLQSIEQCGSSIRDYTDAEGNVGAFQNSFSVYGRFGEACKKCGTRLKKDKVAGRTSVFCPHCQKKK